MNQITKRLEQAITAARTMTADQQDMLAVEIPERTQALSLPATKLSAAERAELEKDLAAARRGEFATDAAVSALYAKHGR